MRMDRSDLEEQRQEKPAESHSETWRPDANAVATTPVSDGAVKPSEGDTTPTAARTLQQNLGAPVVTAPVGMDRSGGAQDPHYVSVTTGTLGPTGDELRDHDFPEERVPRDQQNRAVAVPQRSAELGAFDAGGAMGTKPGDAAKVGTVGAILDQAEASPDMEQSIDAHMP